MLRAAYLSKAQGFIASRTCLTVIIICCGHIGSAAVAQEEAFRAYGNRIVGGTWHNLTAPNAEPAHTYFWTLQQRFLRFHSRAPQGVPNAFAIIGVDPESGVQTWWAFDDQGGTNITQIKSVRIDEQADKLTITSSNGDIEGGFKATFTTEDRLEIDPDPGARQGGNDAPPQDIWVRSDNVDTLEWLDAPIPKNVPPELAFLKGVTGKRWMRGRNTKGQDLVGSSVGRWILNGKFFLYTASMIADDQTVWSHLFVVGIDPVSGLAKGREFSSDGGVGTFQLEADGLSIRGTFHESKDRVFRYSGKFTFEGDKMIYLSKGGVDGEVPQPYEWSYTPVD